MKKILLSVAVVFVALLVLMAQGPFGPLDNIVMSWSLLFKPELDRSPPRRMAMADRKLDIVLGHARAGDAEAIYELCRRFESTEPSRAFEWCQASAQRGAPGAQWMLGNLYEHGAGVARDPAAARRWRREAADNGWAEAMHAMALAYRDGTGVARDSAEARRLLRDAARIGHPPSVAALEAMGEKAPPPPPVVRDAGNAGEFLARVDAGQHYAPQYRFDPRLRREVTVTVSNLRSDPKWAPMFSMCVGQEAAGERVCLALSQFIGQKNLIAATRRLPADRKGEVVVRSTGEEVEPGKPQRLGVYVANDLVNWTLNGNLVAVDKVTFPIQTMLLVCSTADCEVKFETAEEGSGGPS